MSLRLALAAGLVTAACGVGGEKPVVGGGGGSDVSAESDAAPTPDAGEDAGAAVDVMAAEDVAAVEDVAAAQDVAVVRDVAVAADAATDAAADVADAGPTDTGVVCEPGQACQPIPILVLPFAHADDTSERAGSAIDRYACAPDVDESNAEVFYRVEIADPGVLTAAIDESVGDDVDVDVHLLTAPEGERCLARDHVAIRHRVEPGTYWIVVDTWVDGNGQAYPGAYELTVDHVPLAAGACALREVELEMFWPRCAAGMVCLARDGAVFLRTPATGPVVQEAHLATVEDDFGGGWPAATRDSIERHYELSQAATGYEMDRTQPWAPAGEGGSAWGQGSTGRPVPVLDEAWYVTMYWRQRPAGGTRMIASNPDNGRAVVVAAGWETGPGSNEAVAGVAEEVHDWLGTGHRSVLTLGFAEDPDLPLGPIDCE